MTPGRSYNHEDHPIYPCRSAEGPDASNVQTGFESSLGYRHTAPVVKLADTSDLGSEGSGFESLPGYKMLTRRCHLTVRIPDFHSGDPGSNPGGGANGEVADEVIAPV